MSAVLAERASPGRPAPHMPRAMRARVERDLRSYRRYVLALAAVADEESVLTAPPATATSQIGSRSRRSDPTGVRGVRLSDLHQRHGVTSHTARVVRDIDRWLLTLGAEDLMAARMTWRLATSDSYTQTEVAAAVHVSPREMRRRIDRLRWEAAAAMGHLRAQIVTRGMRNRPAG